jgi:hypothetical protein
MLNVPYHDCIYNRLPEDELLVVYRKTSLMHNLCFSIFRQPLHVSGVSGPTRTTDSHLKRIISANFYIHTVVPPDDGSRFFLHDCLLSSFDRKTDSRLKRKMSTNCYKHTVVPPDDGPRYGRNM